MGYFKLSSPDCANGLAAELGVQSLEWYFSDESLDRVAGLGERELADMLMDFRSVFPNCTIRLQEVSWMFRQHAGRLWNAKIVVTMTYSRGGYDDPRKTGVRTVCLRNGSGSLLVNDL